MKTKAFIMQTLATGFGIGCSPLIPGTAASLMALLLYYLLPLGDLLWSVVILLTVIAGIPVGTYMERTHGKDPGIVVIDEFAGQWLACLFLPHGVGILIPVFVFFRIFDILKPFPADLAQRLHGGLGIMADDLIAAVYTQAVIRLGLLLFEKGIS